MISLMGCVMSASDAPPVNQKDLVAHYMDYNGKRITVIGEVASSDEMTVMYRWFQDVGYSVDIRALRQENPNLTTFERWLQSNWRPKAQTA